MPQTSLQKFWSSFFKSLRGGGAEPFLVARRRRNSPYGVFLLRAFLFAPMVSKRKAAMESKPNNSSFSFYHFHIFLSTTKKKKKRNDPKIIAYFLSPRWVKPWR